LVLSLASIATGIKSIDNRKGSSDLFISKKFYSLIYLPVWRFLLFYYYLISPFTVFPLTIFLFPAAVFHIHRPL